MVVVRISSYDTPKFFMVYPPKPSPWTSIECPSHRTYVPYAPMSKVCGENHAKLRQTHSRVLCHFYLFLAVLTVIISCFGMSEICDFVQHFFSLGRLCLAVRPLVLYHVYYLEVCTWNPRELNKRWLRRRRKSTPPIDVCVLSYPTSTYMYQVGKTTVHTTVQHASSSLEDIFSRMFCLILFVLCTSTRHILHTTNTEHMVHITQRLSGYVSGWSLQHSGYLMALTASVNLVGSAWCTTPQKHLPA